VAVWPRTHSDGGGGGGTLATTAMDSDGEREHEV